MKIVSIMWSSYANMLVRAARNVADILQVSAYSSKALEQEPDRLDAILQEASEADILFLYRSSEAFWESNEERLKDLGKGIPIVCCGYDPSLWTLSTVRPEIVANVYSYIMINGEENFTNMLRYIAREVGRIDIPVEGPKPVPWEGLYHPEAPVRYFAAVDEYLEWYERHRGQRSEVRGQKSTVGILFTRHQWVNENLEVEDTLIQELERLGLNVIPAFSYPVKDPDRGCKGSGQVVCETFLRPDGTSRIDAMVKLQNFPLGSSREKGFDSKDVAAGGVEILKRLNVPVFSPVTSYYKTIDEWEDDPEGLGSGVSWSIAMPEFEGVIEPFIVGGASNTESDLQRRMPIAERCGKIARRIANWVALRNKPHQKRKVAFVLHNNPCASVEATVGGGAHLDTLESAARVMQRMKDVGYQVTPPKSGKELITTIMDRKAISEFRWTTVDEIVKKGGVLSFVSVDEYRKWFDALPEKIKSRMVEAWGKPPGEKKNGIPPAMVYEGKIVVTGVEYGNAVVCVQPKRGCAGSRCDGQVCKILHDPDVPPPHQYIATYRYLQDIWGADVIVHIGTHGNLEFLPGKSTALSEACFPDIAIGDMPHLYIYNADNPPEGTIAKRRSYATLIDHIQTVMTQGGLYEGLEELNRFLGEYEQIKGIDKGRAHALEHLIDEALEKTNLSKEIKLSPDAPFEERARAAHEALSRTRNTQIQDGMHIFGELPEGDKRIDFINSILRYDAGEEISLRKVLCKLMGMELSSLLSDQGAISSYHRKSHGELIEEMDLLSKIFIKEVLARNDKDLAKRLKEILGDQLRDETHLDKINLIKKRILDLDFRINASKEIESLLSGFSGNYIPAGPSGLITRGRDDILPTGRNFYSLDPYRVPTKAAWEVGKRLATTMIEKHEKEEGKIPENVAIFWMCSDIMWADGEGMAQIMYLLGVRPVWLSNGRLKGFDVIPLEKIGRPRIDVTIRVSGITRDNFPNCIELIDEAVQAVASLDEPTDMNFVRKHTLAQIVEEGEDPSTKEAWRNATFRLFASKPGTYQAGTQLAVYASAWKDEKDLSDIFVYWNGYAYGKGVFGAEKHRELAHNLKTVDVTYNKVVSDEYDLFGCCCYFGTHGGMTAAARSISGKEIKAYYGDTREPEHVTVRDMADEIRRVVRAKLLNPKWIEGMKRHGYKGAGDISKRIGRVYGWEATTQEVDDWIFDDIASTFVLNKENRKFFEENNPWALEEIGRRLLEAESRGLWNADPEVLKHLKDIYLEIEGWIEEKMGDVSGDFQGGSVDVLTSEDVENWGEMMKEVKSKLAEI
ncbi:MAG: cobaltochelatase subunit CobN [Deltaproteobacteria bacterium]|nr:cobaltochelatase subunit CobN [Deltaproteobacteria bacterium]MBW2020105.1 cobaltochelatase subunit CobN [Deltaproteobacteria bacterium]MBW2074742.1 cobaltochelatase subunit CobN [Deltaproteobacteria bacterium]